LGASEKKPREREREAQREKRVFSQCFMPVCAAGVHKSRRCWRLLPLDDVVIKTGEINQVLLRSSSEIGTCAALLLWPQKNALFAPAQRDSAALQIMNESFRVNRGQGDDSNT
jgi:hypothetical protein